MSEQEVPLLAEYACNERGALPDGRRSCASWGNAVVSSVTAWPELLNKCLGGACATGDDTIRAPLLTARLALLGAVLFAVYSASASLVHKFSRPLLPGTDATERFLDAVVSQRPYGRQPTWSFLWSHEDGLMASPSICEIPAKGLLVATNDLVKEPTLLVHHSTDGGLSWRQVATVKPAFWATVFWHREALHLLGTTGEYADIVVYRSNDYGITWTSAEDSRSGLITRGDQWHRAATPVVTAKGRIWTAVEAWGGAWPQSFRSAVLSAPEDADLLDARSWQFSSLVSYPRSWQDIWPWRGFLEGNFVVAPDGRFLVVLREQKYDGGRVHLVELSDNGLTGIPKGPMPFPGGAKKFSIKYDQVSGRYWTLTSYLQTEPHVPRGRLHLPYASWFYQAMNVRQYQLLMSSKDLYSWQPHQVVVETTSVESASYSDFIFSGDDLLVVLRCALVDEHGQHANNPNYGNAIGFKRLRNFRQLENVSDVEILDHNSLPSLFQRRMRRIKQWMIPGGPPPET